MAGDYTLDAERISQAFARIEGELLDSMWANLERHRVEEAESGFEWTQWQAAQLAEMERYTRENALRCAPEFDALNQRIDELVTQAYVSGINDAEADLIFSATLGEERDPEQGFLRMPRERMDALVRATHDDMMRAEHATLRQAEDLYRQTIFDAQVYATSGAGTYAKAIDMATRDFMAKGVNGIRYRDGSMHGIEEYSRMAVRTATKRAALVAEGEARRQWGVHTVFVNYRTDACPECMQWVGRVLVDDVYGGGTPEEAEAAGYPLLSEAMAQGLFHPNCRDTCSTYFEGVSELPERPTEAERARAEEREAEEQRLDAAENEAERAERLAHFSMDMGDRREAEEKAEAARARAEEEARRAAEASRASVVGTPLDFDEVEKKTYKALMGTHSSKRNNKQVTAQFATQIADKILTAEMAEPTAARVASAYMDRLKFITQKAGLTDIYYSPLFKSVSVNMKLTAAGTVGRMDMCPFEMLFHEFGHLIDNLAASTPMGDLSHEMGFGDVVAREIQGWLDKFRAELGEVGYDGARNELSARLHDIFSSNPTALGGLADMVQGTTSLVNVRGLPAHTARYWGADHAMLSTEAFAEFFECATCNPRGLQTLQEWLPESYDLFQQILEVAAERVMAP